MKRRDFIRTSAIGLAAIDHGGRMVPSGLVNIDPQQARWRFRLFPELPAHPRVHGARALRQQLEQLQTAGAGHGLPDAGDLFVH